MLHQEDRPWHLLDLPAATAAKTHNIALFLGADIPALQSQKQGILDYLSAHDLKIKERTFYHQGNQQLLSAQLKEAVESSPDIIFTVGTLASQQAQQLLGKRQSPIPLVFSGVMKPIESGLSKTTSYTGFHSTGLAENYSNSIPPFVASMRTVRPDLKNMIIVHSNNSASMHEQVSELQRELKTQQISSRAIGVDNCGQVYEKTRAAITDNVDGVIILRDYITTSALPALVRACSEVGATLFASDAHSVEQGAAAGYCVDEYEIGLIIGSSIARILKDGIPVTDLPMIYLDASELCSLRINPFVMHKQGVTTPLEKLLNKPDVVVTHRIAVHDERA